MRLVYTTLDVSANALDLICDCCRCRDGIGASIAGRTVGVGVAAAEK